VTEYYIKTTGWTKFSAVHTEIVYSYLAIPSDTVCLDGTRVSTLHFAGVNTGIRRAINAVLNFDSQNTHYMSLVTTLMTPTLTLNLNSLYFGANV
jgi:hypothetical protein